VGALGAVDGIEAAGAAGTSVITSSVPASAHGAHPKMPTPTTHVGQRAVRRVVTRIDMPGDRRSVNQSRRLLTQ